MIYCFIQNESKRTAIFFVKRCCVWICLYEELITVYYFKGGYIIYINIWRKCSPLIVVLFICLVFFVPLIFTHMDIWRNYVHFIYELNTTWQHQFKYSSAKVVHLFNPIQTRCNFSVWLHIKFSIYLIPPKNKIEWFDKDDSIWF